MKSYEPAVLVELGNASSLVLGLDGIPPDSSGQPDPQEVASHVDVDE